MSSILLVLDMNFKPQESLERMAVILYVFEIRYKMDIRIAFAV